jgi:hypothetical protein
MIPVFGSRMEHGVVGRHVVREHGTMKPSVGRMGYDHDDAAVLRVAIHDFAYERQEAALHVGETLALAMARFEVLVDGPFARQLRIQRADPPASGLDAEVDLDASGASASVRS